MREERREERVAYLERMRERERVQKGRGIDMGEKGRERVNMRESAS